VDDAVILVALGPVHKQVFWVSLVSLTGAVASSAWAVLVRVDDVWSFRPIFGDILQVAVSKAGVVVTHYLWEHAVFSVAPLPISAFALWLVAWLVLLIPLKSPLTEFL
jgi:hypothetical protein